MRAETPVVVHVLQDKLGGIAEIVRRLLEHGARDVGPHEAVLVDARSDIHPRTEASLPADAVRRMTHKLPQENLYSVIDRLRSTLPPGPGVLVAHDWLELATAHRHDLGRVVIQVLHGDMAYYYALAERHREVVDLFVTYSRACQEHLQSLMPDRAADVLLVPYGISMDVPVRAPEAGPLRLCFAGRLDHAHKGVLDLPAIDAGLHDRGVAVQWTVIGAGPDESALRAAWKNDQVCWRGRRPNEEVRTLLATQDVLVLPTRGEGFSVGLLEAMSAGLVPVVSDIRSGVPEVVHEGTTGFRVPVGEVPGFVDAIQRLAEDRALLETMSANARTEVAQRYEVGHCTRQWDAMIATCAQRPRRPWRRSPVPYGSRLDRPWIPNAVVRWIRTAREASR